MCYREPLRTDNTLYSTTVVAMFSDPDRYVCCSQEQSLCQNGTCGIVCDERITQSTAVYTSQLFFGGLSLLVTLCLLPVPALTMLKQLERSARQKVTSPPNEKSALANGSWSFERNGRIGSSVKMFLMMAGFTALIVDGGFFLIPQLTTDAYSFSRTCVPLSFSVAWGLGFVVVGLFFAGLVIFAFSLGKIESDGQVLLPPAYLCYEFKATWLFASPAIFFSILAFDLRGLPWSKSSASQKLLHAVLVAIEFPAILARTLVRTFSFVPAVRLLAVGVYVCLDQFNGAWLKLRASPSCRTDSNQTLADTCQRSWHYVHVSVLVYGLLAACSFCLLLMVWVTTHDVISMLFFTTLGYLSTKMTVTLYLLAALVGVLAQVWRSFAKVNVSLNNLQNISYYVLSDTMAEQLARDLDYAEKEFVRVVDQEAEVG